MNIKKRGSCTDFESYLKERYNKTRSDLLIDEMKQYDIPGIIDVAKSLKAIKDESANGISHKVVVVGDYDCDGVCSILSMALIMKQLSIPFSLIVPRRISEGYGLNDKVLERVIEAKPTCVITIDNGITAVEQIKRLKDMGIKVIVLDHHQKGEELPPADIIVDPATIDDGSDFAFYCGAGLAYKLTEELLPGDPILDTILSLACIATIGDVVPLQGDNRKIVRMGMLNLRENGCKLPGLSDLLIKMGFDKTKEADFFGFQIVPCINGIGRMLDDGAEKAIKILYGSKDAGELVSMNEKRKAEVSAAMDAFDKSMLSNLNYILYLASNCQEGILGIIAGKLAEKYRKPAIVITETEDGYYKGSCRNGREDLYLISEEHNGILTQCKDLFVSCGGHKDAAGLTFEKSKLAEVKRALDRIVPNCEDDESIVYDFEITPSQINEYIESREKAGPFGEGNEEPVVLMTNIPIKTSPYTGEGMTLIGTTKKHVKIPFDGFSAIGFNMAEKFKANAKTVDMVGRVKLNWFNGTATPQMDLIDFEVK